MQNESLSSLMKLRNEESQCMNKFKKSHNNTEDAYLCKKVISMKHKLNQKKWEFELLKHKIKSDQKNTYFEHRKTEEFKLKNKLDSVKIKDLQKYISHLKIVKESMQSPTCAQKENTLLKIAGERNDKLVRSLLWLL